MILRNEHLTATKSFCISSFKILQNQLFWLILKVDRPMSIVQSLKPSILTVMERPLSTWPLFLTKILEICPGETFDSETLKTRSECTYLRIINNRNFLKVFCLYLIMHFKSFFFLTFYKTRIPAFWVLFILEFRFINVTEDSSCTITEIENSFWLSCLISQEKITLTMWKFDIIYWNLKRSLFQKADWIVMSR